MVVASGCGAVVPQRQTRGGVTGGVHAEAALEVRLGAYVRLSAGVVYYNSDQRATELQTGEDGRTRRVGVRSNAALSTQNAA